MLPIPAPQPTPTPPVMPGFADTPAPDDIALLISTGIAQLEAEVEEELRQETTPRYPAWLKVGKGKDATPKDYPRPDPAEILAYVNRLHGEFGDLRNRFTNDIKLLKGTEAGHFADASEDEKTSLYHDSTIEAEHELIVANLGSIDPIYKPLARRLNERDEAADKADFLYACDDQTERRHINLGNGPFRPDVVRSALIYGRIVAQLAYKTECEDGDVPISESLVDPATCMPVHDDHGLAIMARQYRTTLTAACAAFDYDGSMRTKLRDVKKDAKYSTNTTVTVKEYWDRWWKLVWVDEVLVIGPVAHRLGEPPFVYQLGALGLPGFVRSVDDLTPDSVHTLTVFPHLRDAAMPNKGLSHVHYLRYPIWLREALTARILTHFRRQIDPAYLVYQTNAAELSGVPQVTNNPGDVSTAKEGQERIEQVPNNPQAESYGPLMQLNNDALGRLTQPAEAYGLNPSGVSSGFALEGLSENGRDKQMPHLVTLEMFYKQLAEKRLKLYRDWGWVVKQGDEKRGMLWVSRLNPLPNQDPMLTITPGMIRRTGTQVEVRMTKVKMQSLTQVTNALAIMRNMEMGNPVFFYEMLGHPNPERAVELDEYWKMVQDPAYRRFKLIKTLEEQGEVEAAAYLRATKERESAPAQLPTNALSNNNPVHIQGASNAMLGNGPGQPQ